MNTCATDSIPEPALAGRWGLDWGFVGCAHCDYHYTLVFAESQGLSLDPEPAAAPGTGTPEIIFFNSRFGKLYYLLTRGFIRPNDPNFGPGGGRGGCGTGNQNQSRLGRGDQRSEVIWVGARDQRCTKPTPTPDLVQTFPRLPERDPTLTPVPYLLLPSLDASKVGKVRVPGY